MPAARSGCLASILVITIFLSGGYARADLVIKSGTGTDLTNGASWNGSSAPAASDLAVWTTNSLGADLTLQTMQSWDGIIVTGAVSDICISGPGTLTLGAGGIGMSASQVNMSLAIPIQLATDQTWAVNAGETLSMSGAVTGPGNLRKTGGGTLTLSGYNPMIGLIKVNAGTVLVSGSVRSGALTVLSGSTLGGSGSILGNITLAPGAQASFTNGLAMTCNGALVLNNNTIHLALPNQLRPGSYTLATYNAPGSTGAFSAAPVVDSGSLSNGCSARIKTDRGTVTLVVAPPPAPHLAILSVNAGSNVAAGTAFSVQVQAQDANNNPLTMTANTNVLLTLSAGYGTLGGTRSGTILVTCNTLYFAC